MHLIKLFSHDGERSASGEIPFAPFPGLYLKASWARGDYFPVSEVFYDHAGACFEVYLDDRPDPVKPAQTLPNPAQKGANA